MARQLADLDRELGQLLAERVRLLVEVGTDSPESAQAPSIPDGVPGALWRGILDGTVAAAAEARPKALADRAPRKVAIIGLRGIIGSFMAARL